MKNAKRRIVALATSITMAFVLVAAMVPSMVAKAVNNTINSVAFSFVIPEEGTTISLNEYEMPDVKPTVTTSIEGMLHYDDPDDPIPGGEYVTSDSTLTDYTAFTGTLEKGKTYKAIVWGSADDGYVIADDAEVTVSNVTVLDSAVMNEDYYSGVYALVSFTIGGSGDTDAVPVKEGDNQTIALNAPVTISFDKDFSYFKDGDNQGEVYIDGALVPAQYVSAASGSTVITVAQEYLSQLAEGAHTMLVKFLDGSEGSASFTISSTAASDGSSASSTASTATASAATASAATTTKVTAPKTADVLPIAGIALVFVGATAIGVIAFRRKN